MLPGTEPFGLFLQMLLWDVVRGGDSWASLHDPPLILGRVAAKALGGQRHPAESVSVMKKSI